MNDDAHGVHDSNSQIKFKTTMLKSSLCDYSVTQILVKGTTAANKVVAANNTNKKVTLENCAPFNNEKNNEKKTIHKQIMQQILIFKCKSIICQNIAVIIQEHQGIFSILQR